MVRIRHASALAAAGVLMLLAAAGTSGDPGQVTWSGGTVRLVRDEHPSIALVRERIIFEPGCGTTEVTVTLEFRNDGGACTARMGFPTLRAAGDLRGYNYVRNFVVDVDGTPLETVKQKGTVKLRGRDWPCEWFLFEVPFDAGRTRHMTVRYDEWMLYGGGEYARWVQVPYVLATGGTWHGPIGEVQVEVRLGERLNYHELTLKGDDKPLQLDERGDSLHWRCTDYTGTPEELRLHGTRGPAQLKLHPEEKADFPFDLVRFRRGLLLVEVEFLAKLLCLEKVSPWNGGVNVERNARKVELQGCRLWTTRSLQAEPKLFVDARPALEAFDCTMTMTRDEKGDAHVSFTGAHAAVQQTALARRQKTEHRLKCLDTIQERWGEGDRALCEEICRRTREDPAVVQRCLDILSAHDPALTGTLCEEVRGRDGEDPTVLLWAVGFAADEEVDDAVRGRILAGLRAADAAGPTAALSETVLATEYDEVVRGGARVLRTLNVEVAREYLVTRISEVEPPWRWWHAVRRGRNAGLALKLIEAPGASERLIESVRRHGGSQESENALYALGCLGDDTAIPFLVQTFLREPEKGQSRGMNHAAAQALGFLGTPKALAACAELAARADGDHYRGVLLQAFDIVTGRRTYPGTLYTPAQPPTWARTMSVEEACRVAAPLLERLAACEHLRKYEIEKRLAHTRGGHAEARR